MKTSIAPGELALWASLIAIQYRVSWSIGITTILSLLEPS
jgi:hypothetical protein